MGRQAGRYEMLPDSVAVWARLHGIKGPLTVLGSVTPVRVAALFYTMLSRRRNFTRIVFCKANKRTEKGAKEIIPMDQTQS